MNSEIKTPQLEHGYTRIANEIYEAIVKQPLNGYEQRVLHAIIRKTYGYMKKADYISLSQIEELTGISKFHVSRTLSSLVNYNIVTKLGKFIGVNKDISGWKVTKLGNSKKASNFLPKMVKPLPKMVKPFTKLGKDFLPKMEPQKIKDNTTKDNNTKERGGLPKMVTIFIEKFNTLFSTSYQETDGRKDKLNARLKRFTIEQILQATYNLSTSEWHRGKNDRGWKADPDFILRNDEQIDKWLNYQPKKSFASENLNKYDNLPIEVINN